MTAHFVRFLLVEDEEAHAELVCRAFEEREDVSVSVARDLATARELLTSGNHEFDLVFTDLRLPDGVGTSLLDSHGISVPVVIMTSQGDERVAVEAIKRGAYDYVVKSAVAFEEMPRTAERVLREWRHARQEAELREALVQHERLAAIGTAAAMLAHEIGNPLNSMSLSAQLIERRLKKAGEDPAGIGEIVATCRREIERLSSLLQEFRGLARQTDLVLSPIAVDELFQCTLQSQRPALEDAGIEVVVNLPKEPIYVLANREKMTQVIVNLCKNAVEAMPEGGRIELGAQVSEDAVVLLVADSGCGIPDGVQVFQAFTTTKEQGTGLGLAVVAQILASHGGRASHEPAPGGGAQFRLELRRTGPPPNPQ